MKKAVDNQDINGIERIAKIYNYVWGILECIGYLIGVIVFIYILSYNIHNTRASYLHNYPFELTLGFHYIFPLLTLFGISCIRIHATRTNDNGLLGRLVNIKFCFNQFFRVLGTYIMARYGIILVIWPAFPLLIIDQGMTLILHSIRTENDKETNN